MKQPVLGHVAEDGGAAVAIDVDRLIETRLLIQANSGGGKSMTLRRLLEQTHGRVQQIVIDMEGEFRSLRERFDYILAGRDGGDCQAEPRTAKLLAERLLEIGVSAIIDIYELTAYERQTFVATFLDAMINAPKRLWHPVLVIVDEAHVFCPEKSQAPAAQAVMDLMTRGRKRGFCGVLATQRLAKLHKDAAAECINMMIGRTNLDVDVKRAADALGFADQRDRRQLGKLAAGQFFVQGPALGALDVTLIRVAQAVTTHPRAGQRTAPPPPGTEKVRRALAQLAGLEQAAAEEEAELVKLRRVTGEQAKELRDLHLKLNGRSAVPDPEALREAAQRGAAAATAGLAKALGEEDARLQTIGKRLRDLVEDLGGAVEQVTTFKLQVTGPAESYTVPAQVIADAMRRGAEARQPAAVAGAPIRRVTRPDLPPPDELASGRAGKLGGPMRPLVALAQRHPARFTDAQWATLAGFKRTGGSWRTYKSALRGKGYLDERGGTFGVTPAGLAACGTLPPAPSTSAEVIAMWRGAVGGSPAVLLDVAVAAYPGWVTRAELAERSGFALAGGSFRTYLSKLAANGLIEKQGDAVRAAPILFEQAA